MIYFVQDPHGGPVKIGYSADVDARLKQLEGHYGRPLVLLAQMEGGREKEVEIHDRFAHLRIEGLGRRGQRPEQFQPTPELMAFIGRPLLIGANSDTVEVMIPHLYDPSRDDATTKIDRTILSRAKAVASYRGVPVAEILSELVRAPLDKAYGQMLREIEEEGKKG